ncbi:hypothetical protein D9757_001177 [Collybiopsis confluens]|uniref:Protein-S-isoprenylcysteine O-methyltransferase n=1 Tax=Collybiopsis confluens TaxID=2823264 RepID=A0A8H5I196_9AGAR|nr:hypothetical protein D9757_001177 [Collybiopsis confluens]
MSKTITLEQLKTNNSKASIWLLIDGKVYDCTKFTDEHPGGDEVILAEAGKDATEAFEDVGHSDEARALLPDMLIGTFDKNSGIDPKKLSTSPTSAQKAIEHGSNIISGSAMSPSSSTLAVLTQMIVCPSGIPRQSLEHRVQRISPLFIIGVSAVVLGSYIRLTCFKLLGKLFTFDLTVHPEHRLITTSFYSYVRHPAYTGSMLLIAGLTFSHLTKGSWLTECGPLKSSTGALVVWMLWWTWTLACGISRAEAEDRQMQKMFPEEWDKYAENVAWWFFPGLI